MHIYTHIYIYTHIHIYTYIYTYRQASSSVKRDLVQCQKRPSTVSKETEYSVKRDLALTLTAYVPGAKRSPLQEHAHSAPKK